MRHYGGIYIDPNYGCARNLALLLYYPAWVIDRGHGITGARPNHPDWVMLTGSIVTRGFRFLFPHATHGGSTEFGRVSWEKYHARLPAKERKGNRVCRIKTGHRDEVFFMPNGIFRDDWDHSYGYITSTKAILGFLLLFAMLTRRVSCSWQLASKQDPSTRIPETAAVGGRSGMVRDGLTFRHAFPQLDTH
ncbi:hypothetical protein NEUTE1DRAFT_109478 [Neurospora tetrasperma FGSC 2508]|uniref:Uncharacterized protein n=1 Tax=Neurospora tetrasperma (strain FGSC 2508 / ATCC MYA-4615 / P0657) TaxID=510951 RepID=F8MFH4_NEUT8|nr:uncharacterized protein NEUTE1DRAFT_109478 [Neurospora tetrasperma FGSC 2508]EGO60028.1 hypothetical protein NEUTE1DRAFT_109478 [Neurospora tetrasperma FGSC 2508]EGZ74183.1 hypothetical protein NEUTE2DRAFT_138409 [Neurospora tetrasperma FGSC 2509]